MVTCLGDYMDPIPKAVWDLRSDRGKHRKEIYLLKPNSLQPKLLCSNM